MPDRDLIAFRLGRIFHILATTSKAANRESVIKQFMGRN